MKTLLPVLVGVTLVLASAAGSAQDIHKDVLKLSIERKSLRDALNDWAQQTGYQLIAEIRGDYVAPEIEGRLTAEEALERLLTGTPLTYQWMGERLVAVREKPKVVPAALSTPAKEQTIRVARLSGDEPERLRLAADDQPVAQSDQGSRSERRARDVESDTERLEEVVVTAQKRKERLIDVPQSVMVLSADAISKLGASQFRDFAGSVPGLTFTTAGAGWTQVTLRGVTTGYDIGQTVGIYVDEVPYGSSSAFADGPRATLDMNLSDIDRIEVLRGPQGTLYGASSMGGLIKYVTKQPDLDQFAGDARVQVAGTRDGGTGYDGTATLNVPLAVDRAAVRATGFYSHDGGYITNRALGADNVNRSDMYGARTDLLLTPSEELSIRLVGFLQNISRDGEGTADYTFAGAPLDGRRDQRRAIAEPFEQHFRLASGTVTYDFEAATLTSISSYQTSRSEFTFDLSPAYVPLLGLCPPFCRSYSAIGLSQAVSTDKFTQEVRLASDASKKVSGLIGGFYTRETSENEQEFVLRDVAGQPAANDLYSYSGPSRYEEYAAFGTLTYRPIDRFDMSAGVRLARNSQRVSQIGSGLLIGSRPLSQSDDDVVTYLANAKYRFSDHVVGYLRYATGYRPGGPNFVTVDATTGLPVGAPTFDADRLKSYEVGVKTEIADRRLGIELAAYRIDWNDLQVSVVRGGLSAIANAAGGATIDGAELTFTGHVTSAFTVGGAFAYQDARLSQADPDLGAAKGEQLPNVPRRTMAVSADYELPMGSLQPTIGATMQHASDRTASFDASGGFPQYELPSYTKVDLRAGVTLNRFDVMVHVHNLFDEEGQLSARTFQGLPRPAILQPRTVGITVTTRF